MVHFILAVAVNTTAQKNQVWVKVYQRRHHCTTPGFPPVRTSLVLVLVQWPPDIEDGSIARCAPRARIESVTKSMERDEKDILRILLIETRLE